MIRCFNAHSFVGIGFTFDVIALHFLGRCLIDQNKCEEAEQHLKRAVDIEGKKLGECDIETAYCKYCKCSCCVIALAAGVTPGVIRCGCATMILARATLSSLIPSSYAVVIATTSTV